MQARRSVSIFSVIQPHEVFCKRLAQRFLFLYLFFFFFTLSFQGPSLLWDLGLEKTTLSPNT